jgi:hypothetical protein
LHNLNVNMRNCFMRVGVVLWYFSEIGPAAVVANFAGGLRRIGDLGNREADTWSAVEPARTVRRSISGNGLDAVTT